METHIYISTGIYRPNPQPQTSKRPELSLQKTHLPPPPKKEENTVPKMDRTPRSVSQATPPKGALVTVALGLMAK